MKLLLKHRIIIVLLLCVGYSASAQIHIGLRDNRYARIGYTLKDSYLFTLEHSIYSEKFGFQKARLYVGYKHNWKNLGIQANLYASTLWNGNYQDCGVLATAHYRIFNPWIVYATLNPHYDSEYDYMTCFTVATDVEVIKGLALTAQYTTIPEYRLSEKRVRAGLHLSYGNLSVTPLLSIPTDGNTKSIRVLCSFSFSFK